jgi:drug/metabolite transporter (DMT)-like permease
VSGYLFFQSLTFLDLASATTLVFTYPIFVTLLSGPVLGDGVNAWRWSAVLLGFIGVAWIQQAGSSLLQPAALMRPWGLQLC